MVTESPLPSDGAFPTRLLALTHHLRMTMMKSLSRLPDLNLR